MSVAVPMLLRGSLVFGAMPQLLGESMLVGGGLLFLPGIFLTGAFWLDARSGREASVTRRWSSIAIYAIAVMAFWVVGQMALKTVKVGSSIGWIVSLNLLLGYSWYLMAVLSVGTLVVALGGMGFGLLSRSVRSLPSVRPH
jgi:quinol-cytochrome oxidoreductase complex cytochrome b subunit